MKVEKISELTTNRLSIYLRCLHELKADGVNTVSSDFLAKRFRLNSAQIRKDLAYFGEFGVRGVGYLVEDLRQNIIKILGLDKERRVAIIGAGHLGLALANYYGFKQSNFNVVALFDVCGEKIGRNVNGIVISDIRNFAEIAGENQIEVAVLAIPAEHSQRVLDRVTRAGIKAVLNFAPISLQASEDVKLKTVDLTTSLESLAYHLSQSNGIKSETALQSAA